MNAVLPDVLTFGESMVSFRSDGPLTQGGRQTVRLAGAESNVAIGLARLGHAVAWAGRVGDDSFGRLVLRQLRAEGSLQAALQRGVDDATPRLRRRPARSAR